jgi:hypothetical protein
MVRNSRLASMVACFVFDDIDVIAIEIDTNKMITKKLLSMFLHRY